MTDGRRGDVECNLLGESSRCKKIKTRGLCPSGIFPDESATEGCKGRLIIGGHLTKPNSYRIFNSRPINRCQRFKMFLLKKMKYFLRIFQLLAQQRQTKAEPRP
jgi:hypothetical protein